MSEERERDARRQPPGEEGEGDDGRTPASHPVRRGTRGARQGAGRATLPGEEGAGAMTHIHHPVRRGTRAAQR